MTRLPSRDRTAEERGTPSRDLSLEVRSAGAAILLVGADGAVHAVSGWEEAFGSQAPRRLPPGDDSVDELLEAVTAAVEDARQKRGTVKRCVEIHLDRKRTYTIAAGPAAGADAGTAVVAVDITEAFRAGPKEGEAIRQLGHDLRTPLTSMCGAVELLQTGRMGRLTSEQTRLLSLLQQGLERMLSLIDEATAPYRPAAAAGGPADRGRIVASGGGEAS
jgi:signal transduction histidine kinase